MSGAHQAYDVGPVEHGHNLNASFEFPPDAGSEGLCLEQFEAEVCGGVHAASVLVEAYVVNSFFGYHIQVLLKDSLHNIRRII